MDKPAEVTTLAVLWDATKAQLKQPASSHGTLNSRLASTPAEWEAAHGLFRKPGTHRRATAGFSVGNKQFLHTHPIICC